MTVAALIACVVINTMRDLDRSARASLINRAAHFLAPIVLMPVLAAWYALILPEDSRSWITGGSVAMTMFMLLALGATLLIGAYALIGLLFQRLYINGATATLLCALAFAASAGGEFVREGVRKPYTVRNTLYSNALKQPELEYLRTVGSVTHDPYPLRDADALPNDQVRLGARVYRFQCSICHTIDGTNGLTHLTGSWTPDQKRMNISKLQRTKPFMPPFAGNAEEVEALVQFLSWTHAGRPGRWPTSADPEVVGRIARWLQEAGTAPGISKLHGRAVAEGH